MKAFFVLSALLLGAPAFACDYCGLALQTHAAPQQVITYRIVQPQLVRESIQIQRQTYEREPVIVEQRERVLEYSQAPVVGYVAQSRVQKVQVQHVQQVQVQKVRVAPVVVQKQVHAYPATVIQQNTVERRGILGRLRQRSVQTIIQR